MSGPVPFLAPTFPPVDEVAADYAEIVGRGTFSNGGLFEQRLASALATWIGGGVGVSLVASGTAGLLLAIDAAFMRDRPAAIVASFTFPAAPAALARAGYRPVFVDVSPETWQPDIRAADDVLARRADDVAGILLTATLGVADEAVGAWEAMADRYRVPLVIDCAAGFGSRYQSGEATGARGTCEVFSLHATKTLAVGEGGAVSSRSAHIIETVDRLKNFGLDERRQAAMVGTNAKLPELSAAIGLRQLAVLPQRLRARQVLHSAYVERLTPHGYTFQPGAERSAVCFVSARAPDAMTRHRLRDLMQADEIESRTYYCPPVHRQPAFASTITSDVHGDLRHTDDLSARVVSLPTADVVDDSALERVERAARQARRD